MCQTVVSTLIGERHQSISKKRYDMEHESLEIPNNVSLISIKHLMGMFCLTGQIVFPRVSLQPYFAALISAVYPHLLDALISA